jgi:ELWxxDGT repeat protein
MSSFLRYSIMAVTLLVIMACIFTSCQPDVTPDDNPGILTQASVLALTVQPQSTTFSSVGQVVNYNFVLTNNGNAALTGPLTMTDSKITVACPQINTVGNLNGNLDPGESITCTGSYTITQADLTACAVTDIATASIGGVSSNTVTTTIRCPAVNVLGLTITPTPTTYSIAGTVITYNYTVTNNGMAALTGPFLVTISGNPVPITCGTATTVLAQGQTVTCSSTYTTTSADLQANQVTHTATATGPGGATSQQVSVNVMRAGTPNPGGNPNIPRGSDQNHTVEPGEWLLQISRCYGADYNAVVRANPTIIDPHWIYPAEIVRVPNVGSNGTVYGKPCIEIYTVVAGDTWESIANAKNADLEVFREANRNVSLTPGNKVKVPLNSRQSGIIIPPTQPSQTDPIRLNFSATTPSISQQGTANAPTTVRYVFSGTTGQVLTVRLTVATNDLNLAVYGPNNTTLKAPDATTSWSGTLTATGDHFIDVIPRTGATNRAFTLDVTLNTPAPALSYERVADIFAGSGSSNPSHLAVFNGGLYFQGNANDGVGAELWKYDRGLNAISRVADIMPGDGGSEPAYLTPFGEMLYFRANGNDGAGLELWRLNGAGAWGRVGDLYTGTGDANPMYMTVFNNALYFSANGNDGRGVELWRYDGATATRVTDINPDAGDSSPAYLEVFNNALYFSATSNDGSGTELWRYDGTTTTRVDDINEGVGNSNPAFLTVFNNALYFSADGNDGAGTELWRFDGTSVARAADINVGAAPSIPTYLAVFGNALYFSANGDASGFELWKFDGTTASRVADINNAGNSNPAYLTVYNNELYFQATGSDNAGAELWKFRGP